MDINSGDDFIRFNNFFISPSGINSGIGTYSSSWNFICASASIGGTTGHISNPVEIPGVFASASFRFGYDSGSWSANSFPTPNNFTPKKPIFYIDKGGSTSVDVRINNPSFDGFFLVVRRRDTNAGNLTLLCESGTFFRPAANVSNTTSVTLDTASSNSRKFVYFNGIWFQV